jgi:intracellular sulfur oxidation DsrE/DsrF family protein
MLLANSVNLYFQNSRTLDMQKITNFLMICIFTIMGYAQTGNTNNELEAIAIKRDSTLKALYSADSLKVEQQYQMQTLIAKLKPALMFPVINAGTFSGVLPVKDPTQIPDPKLDYKLLFELVMNKPDSLSGLNADLVEISRIINLHVASGIPVKKIYPVIVVHGPALNDFTNNTFYNEQFKRDNPNIKLISDLEALGVKFIACGQAMQIFGVPKEALLPLFKVSLTAQTVLSSYQLQGYVKMQLMQ